MVPYNISTNSLHVYHNVSGRGKGAGLMGTLVTQRDVPATLEDQWFFLVIVDQLHHTGKRLWERQWVGLRT